MNDPRFEKIPLSSCLAMAHERNPKDHDIEKLIESFTRFGFVAFPTIDERSQVMVAGHGRCEALAKLRNAGVQPPRGIEEAGTEWMVPVIRGISFDNDRERDAYVIADNQQVVAGGWKFDVLSEILTQLRGDGGLEGLGFDQVELDSLLGDYVPDPPIGTSGSAAPNEPEPTRARTEITARVECPKCGHLFER